MPMPPIRFRLRTLTLVIGAAAVLLFLVRVRAQMNAFFDPIPLFDLSVFAGVVLGATVGFVLVWVRYWSLRAGSMLGKGRSSNHEVQPGPKRGAGESVG
jgi:hypothetical protein